jgi:cell wall-associated NlpC family hydrolase
MERMRISGVKPSASTVDRRAPKRRSMRDVATICTLLLTTGFVGIAASPAEDCTSSCTSPTSTPAPTPSVPPSDTGTPTPTPDPTDTSDPTPPPTTPPPDTGTPVPTGTPTAPSTPTGTPSETSSPSPSPSDGDPAGVDGGTGVDQAALNSLQAVVDKAQSALDAAQSLLDTAAADYKATRTAHRSAKALDSSAMKIEASAESAAKAAAAKFMVALQQTHSDPSTTALNAVFGGSSNDLLERLTAANQLGGMNGSLDKLASRAMSTAKHADAAKAAATKAHAAFEAIPLAEKLAAKKAAKSVVDAAQDALDSATDALTAASIGDTDSFFTDDLGVADPGADSDGGGFAPNATQVAAMLAYAEAQLGDPYVLGGAGPDTWDCSGLTMMAYKAAGIDIGDHAVIDQLATMRDAGRLLPYSDRERGDLIFWQGSDGSFPHVAIYLGHNTILAAPQEGETVKIQPMWSSSMEHVYGLVARPSGTP